MTTSHFHVGPRKSHRPSNTERFSPTAVALLVLHAALVSVDALARRMFPHLHKLAPTDPSGVSSGRGGRI